MILALGSLADETFSYTVKRLATLGHTVHVIDQALLVCCGFFELHCRPDLRSRLVALEKEFRLANYDAIYVRLTDISNGSPDLRTGERCRAMYYALTEVLTHVPYRVLNPPLGDSSNFSKLLHTKVWSSLGLRIPESCLTNEPDAARRFIEKWNGNVIFKGASATKTWVSTVEARHMSRLDSLRSSPVLFQQKINGPDVRIHVVNSRVFAEQIVAPVVDYRNARGKNVYTPALVPSPISAACLQISEGASQPLMGIDFKIEEKTGEWYFLEANSMPCYQAYDKRAHGKISEAISEYLLGADGNNRMR